MLSSGHLTSSSFDIDIGGENGQLVGGTISDNPSPSAEVIEICLADFVNVTIGFMPEKQNEDDYQEEYLTSMGNMDIPASNSPQNQPNGQSMRKIE